MNTTTVSRRQAIRKVLLIVIIITAVRFGSLSARRKKVVTPTAHTHVSSKASASDTVIAILMGERLRSFEGFEQLDQVLSNLSENLPLRAFLVTDSYVPSTMLPKDGMLDYRVLERIHFMDQSEIAGENEFVPAQATKNYPGLYRQWYKVALAYRDMREYEESVGANFTHILKTRSDLQYFTMYPLDALDLTLNGIVIRTDQVFFAKRFHFPDILISRQLIDKYWNRYDEYFVIDPRVVLESNTSIAKFEFLCWPEFWLRDSLSDEEKTKRLDNLNHVISQNMTDNLTACIYGGPNIPFGSERVFLLNLLVQNISVHSGLPSKPKKDRKRNEVMARPEMIWSDENKGFYSS